jgi:hypothetical protein
VLCVVVVDVAAGCVVVISRLVDVVEVVAGFSTTVVQELNAMVITARAGMRIMSFFMCKFFGSPSVRS